MDNFNSEPTNQFPNQENQDMNFTQNNLSPQEPAIDTPENDMSLENNGNNLNSAQELFFAIQKALYIFRLFFLNHLLFLEKWSSLY